MLPSDLENLSAKFTFESDKSGVVEEPPFRILVLGDWSGSVDRHDARGRPIEIDRDNFDDVMAKLGPTVRLGLQERGEPVVLRFGELDDFHPDRIFEQVPLFSELRELRRRLLGRDAYNSAAREVYSRFSEPQPPRSLESSPEPVDSDSPTGSALNLLDQILDQPAGGSKPVRTGTARSAEMDNLLAALVRPHLLSVDEDEQSHLVAAVDAASTGLMRSILHDHGFQALEAAWRGLYFLVRRAETDTELKILVLDVSKEALGNELRTAEHLSDSRLHKILIEDALETPGGEPWAAVFGNFAFLPNRDDIAELIRLTRLCSAAGAPFISHMRPEVLGVHTLAAGPDPIPWNVSDESDVGKLWAALRNLHEAGHLGLVMPRFLVRLPYGVNTEPLETFNFEEFPAQPDHDKYLWANPCFAAALLLVQSYREYGWSMGNTLLQDIEDMPLHTYKRDGETISTPCAEALLTQSAAERMMEYGLIPLVSFKNADKIRLARWQSASDPVSGLKGRWNR
ncbi:MAG: type VI secretion system contractile sheath large subunit [Pyrinomonadaceae bacterium]